MAIQEPIHDTTEVLLRRSAVIERLSVEPTAKRDLVDGLDVSRSTVDRAVREIESLGLVDSGDGGVSLTLCGRLAVEEFERFGSRLADRCGVGDAAESVIADLIATAVRRNELLDLLAPPLDKRDLVEELSRSRSTIDRTMRELEVLGVVEYVSDGFVPTEIGHTLLEEYEAFVERLDGILAASDLLSVLDPDVELDTALLADAEIVTQEPVATHVPATHLMELLRETDRLTCVARAHSYSRSMETFYPLVVNDEVDTRFVFPAAMVEHVQSAYPEQFGRMLRKENFAAFVVDHTPYGLFIIGTQDVLRVCLLVYSADNDLKGAVLNTSDAAVEWGRRLYRTYEDRAEPVTA